MRAGLTKSADIRRAKLTGAMCSICNEQYLQCAVFAMCNVCNVQCLQYAVFAMCSICNVKCLKCAIFATFSICNVQYLQCAVIAMNSVCNVQCLHGAVFGLCVKGTTRYSLVIVIKGQYLKTAAEIEILLENGHGFLSAA